MAKATAAAEAPAQITVVAQGDVTEVNFTAGMKLKDAIAAAGLRTDGVADVRVNNATETDMNRLLEPRDQVHLLRKIRGA